MFTLTFNTENEAFYEDPTAEIARILRRVGQKVEGGDREGPVFDVNGNRVGTFTLAGEGH